MSAELAYTSATELVRRYRAKQLSPVEVTQAVLARVRETQPDLPTKSGIMLGLGETPDEVRRVMRDLLANGVRMLTLGQYLRPSRAHLPVAEYVDPSVFARLARDAYKLGFSAVASAPYVRSSYHAGELAELKDSANS